MIRSRSDRSNRLRIIHLIYLVSSTIFVAVWFQLVLQRYNAVISGTVLIDDLPGGLNILRV